MNNFSHVPPGFRFHPTDEELVDYYLRKKIASKRIDLDVIKDIDLYRIEPWDLQDLCKLGTEEQNEWYFFSHKDKKYPTGTRTNRATKAGFWKATGRDKAIYSKNNLVGMRKTLVFYKGRAPNGQKSDWIMHEYRLETNENGTRQEEGWVVCRVFKKRITTVRRMDEHDSLGWFDDQVSFMPNFESPKRISTHPYTSNTSYHHHQFPAKSELDQLHYNLPQDHSFLQLPQLESPKIQQPVSTTFHPSTQQLNINLLYGNNIGEQDLQLTDWRVLDKFVASQLSNEQDPSNPHPSSLQMTEHMNMLLSDSKSDEMASECASISTSTCQADLWK
ncbi:NAC domain-containing protein 7 [Lactuca sativa]|uniref:NAC domain-containing protein 7 n=1 Tax=Lactuca sativa TaxID=4236 RepID=UPI0022B03535|nr:NAC domain-containing protein 7 [Lactuca sativa]